MSEDPKARATARIMPSPESTKLHLEPPPRRSAFPGLRGASLQYNRQGRIVPRGGVRDVVGVGRSASGHRLGQRRRRLRLPARRPCPARRLLGRSRYRRRRGGGAVSDAGAARPAAAAASSTRWWWPATPELLHRLSDRRAEPRTLRYRLLHVAGRLAARPRHPLARTSSRLRHRQDQLIKQLQDIGYAVTLRKVGWIPTSHSRLILLKG